MAYKIHRKLSGWQTSRNLTGVW